MAARDVRPLHTHTHTKTALPITFCLEVEKGNGAEGLRSPCPNQTAHQEDCPHLEGSCQNNCDLLAPSAGVGEKTRKVERVRDRFLIS